MTKLTKLFLVITHELSDWICKNMAIEISLVYFLTESFSGAYIFFSWLFFIYLNCTDYLLNRLQYLDFDEFLTGINLPLLRPPNFFS